MDLNAVTILQEGVFVYTINYMEPLGPVAVPHQLGTEDPTVQHRTIVGPAESMKSCSESKLLVY